MSANANRQGGTNSYKQGVLKRPLPPVTVFSFQPAGTGVAVETTAKLRLRGLSPNFNVIVSAGIVQAGGSVNVEPQYPPLPGSLKVTPYQQTADGTILYLKDLTLAPQILPASYTLGPGLNIGATADNPDYGVNIADGAIIRVTVDPAPYLPLTLSGTIIVAVTATYNGDWFDIQTIEQMISQLTIDSGTPIPIATAGA